MNKQQLNQTILGNCSVVKCCCYIKHLDKVVFLPRFEPWSLIIFMTFKLNGCIIAPYYIYVLLFDRHISE